MDQEPHIEEPLEPDEVVEPRQGSVKAIVRRKGLLPQPSAVSVATGSFVAGAATVAAVGIVRSRRGGGLLARKDRKKGRLEPVLSKSFLIDVHLLNR